MSGETFVYVIGGDGDLRKIGISGAPKVRLAALRNASPFDLRFEYIAACRHEDGRRIEEATHRLLAQHRTAREWFRVDLATAARAVADGAAEIGCYVRVVDLMEFTPRFKSAPKKRVPLAMRIDSNVKAGLEELARYHGRSLSNMVETVMRSACEAEGLLRPGR